MESDKHELFMDLATLGFSPCLSRKRALWTLRKAAKSERTLTFPSARRGKCSMDKAETSKIEAKIVFALRLSRKRALFWSALGYPTGR